MKGLISTFNKGVSEFIDKMDSFYEAYFGAENFVPNGTIVRSSDFNCGALGNELEMARTFGNYIVSCLDYTKAEGSELQDIIDALVDLPRRGSFEDDATYRLRYEFIVVQKGNPTRTTKSAILDAISYFVSDISTVEIFEPQVNDTEFQIRIRGVSATSDILALDNLSDGFLDINYIGGQSIGAAVTFIGALIQRIKAAGVDFSVVFINRYSISLTSSMTIGSVQKYLTSNIDFLAHRTLTFTSAITFA